MQPPKMQLPNLPDIGNPDDYTCQVENYVIGHSMMAIKATHDTDASKNFDFDFAHVFCFSGVMQWRSARVRVGLNEEHLAFLRELLPQYEKPYEKLLDTTYYGRLYIFEAKEAKHASFRLIATNGEIVKRLH